MRFIPLLPTVLIFGLLGASPAGELSGRVVGVSDGDTLTLLTPGKTELKVRLEGIDAPETDQPWGAKSKQALSRQVFGRVVTVRSTGEDRYGRTLGQVQVDGRDVNAQMVAEGAAWAYRQYLTDDALLTLEKKARAERRGLWALPPEQAAPPWSWRAERRAGYSPDRSSARTVPTSAPVTSRAGFSCGVKRYCRQMSSCADARRHLTQCGVRSLDGDGDGTPCESLCRA